MVERKSPLAGLKIIELAWLGPAPFCVVLLAKWGAEVAMINRLGGAAASYAFDRIKEMLNRGRHSLVLDLKARCDVDVGRSRLVWQPARRRQFHHTILHSIDLGERGRTLADYP